MSRSWANVAASSAVPDPSARAPPAEFAAPQSVVAPAPVADVSVPAAVAVATPAPVEQPKPATTGLTSLFFGDLHHAVTQDFLKNILSELKSVTSIKVCKDRTTRESLGYAYVNFSDEADATMCLDRLNFMPICGQPVRITRVLKDRSMLSSGKGNIFIKGLCKTIDNRTLHHTFSQFGTVFSSKVRENPTGATTIAWVQYNDTASAERAIAEVNGKYVEGKQVTVEFYVPRASRNTTDPETTYTNVFVKPLAKTVTDEKLKEHFGKFGEITSACVRVGADGACAGFGFVAYKEHAMAKAAVEGTHGKVVPGLSGGEDGNGEALYVARMQPKKERERNKVAVMKEYLADREKYTNFYVKNFPLDTTEEQFRAVFSRYGDIKSSKIQLDESGKSVGFGFVSFSDKDAAERAMMELNGKMDVFPGEQKPQSASKGLYMNRFQTKKDRVVAAPQAQPGAHASAFPMGPMWAMHPSAAAAQMAAYYGMGTMSTNYGPGRGYMPVFPNFGGGGPRMQQQQQHQQWGHARAARPQDPQQVAYQNALRTLSSYSQADLGQNVGDHIFEKVKIMVSSLLGGEQPGAPDIPERVTGVVLDGIDHPTAALIVSNDEELRKRVSEAFRLVVGQM